MHNFAVRDLSEDSIAAKKKLDKFIEIEGDNLVIMLKPETQPIEVYKDPDTNKISISYDDQEVLSGIEAIKIRKATNVRGAIFTHCKGLRDSPDVVIDAVSYE